MGNQSVFIFQSQRKYNRLWIQHVQWSWNTQNIFLKSICETEWSLYEWNKKRVALVHYVPSFPFATNLKLFFSRCFALGGPVLTVMKDHYLSSYFWFNERNLSQESLLPSFPSKVMEMCNGCTVFPFTFGRSYTERIAALKQPLSPMFDCGRVFVEEFIKVDVI